MSNLIFILELNILRYIYMDRFNINQLHNLFQTKLSTLNTPPPYIIMYIIAFLYIYILTMFGKSVLLTKNVFIQLSIWVITIFTSIKLNNNYILFAPLIIFLINELVYFKYGHDIGKVVKEIKKGEHVHVHNVKTKKW